MKWYKKVIKDYSSETIVSVCITLSLLLGMAVFQLINGDAFAWHNITPIDQPDIFVRYLYSALTFLTIGALLYYLWFYKLLSMLFGRDRSGYRSAKKLIWLGLMLFTYFVIVPVGVGVANSLISFLYNVLVLLVYVSPAVFVILLGTVFVIIYPKIRKRTKQKKL